MPAEWSTNTGEVSYGVDVGTFWIEAPLYDNDVLQGWLRVEMTENRELKFTWEHADGVVEGLTAFEAWSDI